MARIGTSWASLQPTSSAINWSSGIGHDLEVSFDCLINHDIKLLWILGETPSWAKSSGTSLVPDETAWRNFVYEALDHFYNIYGDDITFEIWNEPDGQYLEGCPSGYDKGECWSEFIWQPAADVRNTYFPYARLAGPGMLTTDSRLTSAISGMTGLQSQDVLTFHHYYPSGLSAHAWYIGSLGSNRETWATEVGSCVASDSQQYQDIDDIGDIFDGYSGSWDKMFVFQVSGYYPDYCNLIRADYGPLTNRAAFDAYKSHLPDPLPGVMTADSAVRGCSNYSEWSPVWQQSKAACLEYCWDNNADSCEYEAVNGGCYVEFGQSCYVQGGFSGWYAWVR
jgi:hypothetical protein